MKQMRSRSSREARSPWSSRAAAAVQATRAGLGLFPDPNPVGLETSPAVVPRWVSLNLPESDAPRTPCARRFSPRGSRPG